MFNSGVKFELTLAGGKGTLRWGKKDIGENWRHLPEADGLKSVWRADIKRWVRRQSDWEELFMNSWGNLKYIYSWIDKFYSNTCIIMILCQQKEFFFPQRVKIIKSQNLRFLISLFLNVVATNILFVDFLHYSFLIHRDLTDHPSQGGREITLLWEMGHIL